MTGEEGRGGPERGEREKFLYDVLPANQLNGENWLFVLNEVGSRIWELIDRGRSVQQIEQLLLEEFDTTPEQLEKDLLQLLGQLQELGAIEAIAE